MEGSKGEIVIATAAAPPHSRLGDPQNADVSSLPAKEELKAFGRGDAGTCVTAPPQKCSARDKA
jgi:hypothetical protein